MPAVGKTDHDVATCQKITHCCEARNGGVYKHINYGALQLQLSTIDWRALMAMKMICGKYFTTSLARLYVTVRKLPYRALCICRNV